MAPTWAGPGLLTLAMSKWYEKVRMFFSARQLSFQPERRTVQALVVSCLLFNPEVSRSNQSVRAIFLQGFQSRRVPFQLSWHYEIFPLLGSETFSLQSFLISSNGTTSFFRYFATEWKFEKSQRFPSSRFCGTMTLIKVPNICFFSENFETVQKFPSIFSFFTTEWVLKNLIGFPLYNCRPCEIFFKVNICCLKIRFSQAQHALSDFFWGPAFFVCDFLLIFFSSKPDLYTFI